MNVTDHNGKEFATMNDMAKYYGMATRTLNERLTKMSLKDALTTPVRKTSKGTCQDHLGNTYPSKRAMCEAYGIDRAMFFGRISIGWSLEDALTKPYQELPSTSKTVTDHTGQTFISVSEMCKHWKMTRVTYNARRKAGWSIEKALTTPIKRIKVEKTPHTDHLGNTYESLNEMCRAYGITRWMYQSRIENGWSVKDALTKPISINATECHDGFGNTFPSLKDLGNYYNIREYFFQGKHLSEDETREMIIKQTKKGKEFGDITIIKKIEFPYFLVSKHNESIILTFNQILHEYHNSNTFSPLPKAKIKHKLIENTELIKWPYYNVKLINEPDNVIMSYWSIISLNKKSNFGLSERTAAR